MTKTRLERIGDVHVLTLADPEKRNAIGHELAQELITRADELVSDSEVRVLVLAAEGPVFCAGADMTDVFGQERSTAEMRTILREYYECFLRLRGLPFPTLAAVDGAAIGAGLNLALCCRIRIASPRAQFGATFTRIGLHPGGGCSYFLVEAIGRQRALRLLLEGGTLDAATALENHLVAELDEDPLATALAIAKRTAALEPWLARSVIQSVDLAAEEGIDAVLDLESWAQAESTHAPRFREYVAAFGR